MARAYTEVMSLRSLAAAAFGLSLSVSMASEGAPTGDLAELVSTAIAKGQSLVSLGKGVYRLSKPLVLDSSHSGTKDRPFVIESSSPGQTEIKGSVVLAPWKVRADGKWESPAPSGVVPEQLFINGQRRLRPTWPHKGHLFVKKAFGVRDRFAMSPAEVPSWLNEGEGINAIITHHWGISWLPIQKVEKTSGVISLAGSTWHDVHAELKPGVWFRLENTPLSTMRPGEWRYDAPSRRVIYSPLPGEKPASTAAETPVVETLVSIKGAKNLVLRGLSFAQTKFSLPASGRSMYQAEADLPGTIQAEDSSDLLIEDCLVSGTGGYGAVFGEGTKGAILRNCEFVDLGAGGVRIGGMTNHGKDSSRHAGSISVENCVFSHGGRLHPAGIGVLVLQAGNCTIKNNTIRDFYYSGISVGWTWGSGYSPAVNNQVVGNRIDLIGQGALSDMAGIYTLGESPGTVVKGNIVTRVERARYGGWGIYFDEGSRHILVEDNLAAFTQDSPFHIHYGADNTVRRNVFAYGRNAQMQFSNMAKSGPLLIEDNIFLWKEGPLFEKEPDEEIVFRGNTYWREVDPGGIKFAKGKAFDEWKELEPGMKVAKPVFPNPQAMNFGSRFPGSASPSSRFRLYRGQNPLSTFPPAPGQMVKGIEDGFEDTNEGLVPGGWTVMFAGDQTKPTVSAKAAKTGSKSLRFADGAEGEPWMPHAFSELNLPPGPLRSSFWIMMRPGAAMAFEWRDTNPWYTPGPGLEIRADGAAYAQGREVGRIPANQWVEVILEAGMDSSSHTLIVVIPGQKAIQALLSHSASFKKATWAGFTSLGAPGTEFFVDDIVMGPGKAEGS
jgi:hypothetical protein